VGDAPSPELRAVAARAQADDPAARYPDAGALAEELARWVDGRRVLAHEYSAAELVVRLARVWRVPLAVAGAAAVVLLVVVASATARVAAERDRATASAASAVASLAERDASLSLSLASAAASAAAEADCSAAEPLAVQALRSGEQPLARGALAACGVRARARKRSSHALADCASAGIDAGATRAACATAAGLRLVAVDDGRTLGAWDLHPTHAALSSDGRWIAAVVAGRQHPELVVLDADAPDRPPVVRVGHAYGRLTMNPTTEMVFAAGALGRPSLAFRLDGSAAPALTVPVGVGQAAVAYDASPGLDRVCWLLDPDVLICGGDVVGTWPLRALDDRLSMGTLVMTPDAVLLGSTTGVIARLRPADGRLDGVVPLRVGVVRALSLHPTIPRLVLVEGDSGAAVFDHERMEVVVRLPFSATVHPRWTADGAVLMGDGAVERWEVPTEVSPHVFEFPAGLSRVEASPDGRRFAVSGAAGLARVVDLATGAAVQLAHSDSNEVVKGVTFAADGGRVAAWGGLGGVSVWDGDRLTARVGIGAASGSAFRRVALIGGEVVAIGFEPELWVRDPRGAAWSDVGLPVIADDMVASPRRQWVAVLGGDGVVSKLPAVGPPDLTEVARGLGSGSLDLSDDGETVVIAEARSLSLRRGGALRWQIVPDDDVLSVALSPDGALVAGGTRSGEVHLWSAVDGALVARLQGHTLRVVSVDFALDSAHLFSASWDHTVRRWALGVIGMGVEGIAAEVEGG
jgi:hypothetical protein